MPDLLSLEPQQEIDVEFFWRGVSSGPHRVHVASAEDGKLTIEVPNENGREMNVQLGSRVTVTCIDGETVQSFESEVSAKKCDATTMFVPYLVIPLTSVTESRRQYSRLVVDHMTVKAKLVDVADRHGSTFVADVDNLGAGGMRITARRPLRTDWNVELDFDFDGHSYHARARVVYSHDRDAMPPKRVTAGLEFIQIAESDRVTLGRAIRSALAAGGAGA